MTKPTPSHLAITALLPLVFLSACSDEGALGSNSSTPRQACERKACGASCSACANGPCKSPDVIGYCAADGICAPAIPVCSPGTGGAGGTGGTTGGDGGTASGGAGGGVPGTGGIGTGGAGGSGGARDAGKSDGPNQDLLADLPAKDAALEAADATPKQSSFRLVNHTQRTAYVQVNSPIGCRMTTDAGWQECAFFGAWCMPSCTSITAGESCCMQCAPATPALYAIPPGGSRTWIWDDNILTKAKGLCSECECSEKSSATGGQFEASVRVSADYECAYGPCQTSADGIIDLAASRGPAIQLTVPFAVLAPITEVVFDLNALPTVDAGADPDAPATPDGPDLDRLAQLCLDTGGTIETAECCADLSDFGNLCNYGTNPRCSCAPEASHAVKVCKCPGENRCFAPEPTSLSSQTGCIACPALNSCNWCDGNALPRVELGCPLYWHCANGVNPCSVIYRCGDCESCTHCQAGERCLADGLCWPTAAISVTGVYQLAGATSSHFDLSLSTPAYSVVDGSQFYVLLLGGQRITDPSGWSTWAGTVPQPGDTVTITGVIVAGFEGNGQHDYREIELETLSLVP